MGALSQPTRLQECTLTPAIDLDGTRQVSLAFAGDRGRVVVELTASEAQQLGAALCHVADDPELRVHRMAFVD